ncbi:MAG: GlsB/YeaQ/YmgE family stress response membrane protein [Chloroflexota bacterium]
MSSLLGWIILGGLAGWLAGQLTKGRGFGCLGNVLLGIVGSVVGGWLFSLIGFRVMGGPGSFVAAVIGAIVVVAIAQIFTGRR